MDHERLLYLTYHLERALNRHGMLIMAKRKEMEQEEDLETLMECRRRLSSLQDYVKESK